MNFTELVFNDTQNDDKSAFIVNDHDVSYKDLKANIKKYYKFLQQNNITKGENVVLIGTDSHYFVSMVLACWAAGIKTYCPSPSFSMDSIKTLCDRLQVKNIFCNDDNHDELSKSFNCALHPIEQIVQVYDDGIDIVFYQWSENEIVHYFNTTGSSGVPKLIPHPMSNLVNYAVEWAEALSVEKQDTIYCCPKICFNYGFGISLLVNLFKKTTAILHTGSTSPNKIKHVFKNYQPDYFFVVPEIAYMLALKKLDIDLSNVKKFISASDFLPTRISEEIEQKYNKKLLDLIGMAETFGFYTIIDEPNYKKGTVGKPMANVQIKIEDDIIHVKTNFSAKQYLNDKNNTDKVFKGEWVRTRDRGHFDNDGYLVFDGRADNLIKIKSKFLSPIEVENVLTYYPGVVTSLINVEHDEYGLPVLCAQLVVDSEVDTMQLKKWLKTRLEPHKIPKKISFINEIRTTYNGKKIRQQSNV
jgi:acyl-coenzyme A synthetase/AMP-(fatty) acid ligase